ALLARRRPGLAGPRRRLAGSRPPRHELRPGARRPRPRQRRAHRGGSPPPPRGGHRAWLARTARGGAGARRERVVDESRGGAARVARSSAGARWSPPGRGGGVDRRPRASRRDGARAERARVAGAAAQALLGARAHVRRDPRRRGARAHARLRRRARRVPRHGVRHHGAHQGGDPRRPPHPGRDELLRGAPAPGRAWSEFNHNVAGLFVLAMGLLAILHAAGRARWARHWPLIFLGLAVFLMIRDDPGAWPLGPLGFWESWAYPAVFQHRVFVLLVIVFAAFEWMVRADRVSYRRAALVFPLLCAVGGGLLLTHSHASLGLKEEFLTEVTHAPLGLLGMLVGWAR